MDYSDYLSNVIYYVFKNEEIQEKIKERIKNDINIIIELSFNSEDNTTSNFNSNVSNDSVFNNNINVIIYEKQSIKDVLKTLPKYRKIKDIETTEECSICLQKYTENTFKRTLDCSHHFHKKCIDKWLKQCDENNIHCPICRKQYEIKVNQILKFNIGEL